VPSESRLDSQLPVGVFTEKRWVEPKARRISRRAATRVYLKNGMTDDDKWMTLKEASKDSGFTVSTLRAEHDRGRLTINRVGRRHYTTRADIRGMVQECRVAPRGHDSTLIGKEANGSSATERFSAAQVCRRRQCGG
jgi:hypothetical protein